MRISRPALLLSRLLADSGISFGSTVQFRRRQLRPNRSATRKPWLWFQRALLALTGGANVADVTLTGTARRIAGSDDETGTAAVMAGSSLQQTESRFTVRSTNGNSESGWHSVVGNGNSGRTRTGPATCRCVVESGWRAASRRAKQSLHRRYLVLSRLHACAFERDVELRALIHRARYTERPTCRTPVGRAAVPGDFE